jgi:multicomponent Na+:H+ antiporter subunit B
MTTFEVASAVLLGILLVTALAITRARSLFVAAMLGGLFSLAAASLFVLLDAVDVAFTEAAVGAGISTVLFITALALTNSRESTTPRRRVVPAGLVAVLATAGLIYASQDLPGVGDPLSPVQTHPITETYLQESQDDLHVPNTVTGVLASYRGYDTLGEVVVIFTAGIGVLLLMLGPRRAADETKDRAYLQKQYLVLRVVSKTLMPFILLFALYVLLHGEYGPGGGFQAGVIFGAGFILYTLMFGLGAVQRVLPMRTLVILVPAGVLLFAGVGVATMALGGGFLDYNEFNPGDPSAGQVTGILLIEIGVGITVAAVMVAMFYALVRRGVRR